MEEIFGEYFNKHRDIPEHEIREYHESLKEFEENGGE